MHPQYTDEVPAAVSKTDISKIKVLDSRKTTSALRTFRFSTTLVRHAVVVLLVSLGSCSLLKTHPASAAVVGDAPSAKSASPGKLAWHSCEGNPANVDCAQVQVPLDWNHPDGPQISLAVARHRASAVPGPAGAAGQGSLRLPRGMGRSQPADQPYHSAFGGDRPGPIGPAGARSGCLPGDRPWRHRYH
jgi:hypothetical protein